MASTNKTTHYNLDQYISTDKPTYLTDYNNDMSAIDTGMYNAQSKADSAYTLAGTADGKADTAITNAGTAQTDASTALTRIGTMANLDTTEKTNLVGAINEVNSDITKFNLTNFTSYTGDDIVVTGGTLTTKAGTLYVATNSDGSIFKFYTTGLKCGYSGAGSWTCKISTDIRPSSNIEIAGGLKMFLDSGSEPYWISGCSFTVKTNGDIEFSFSKSLSNDYYQYFYFPACLYFAKDFGDTPDQNA